MVSVMRKVSLNGKCYEKSSVYGKCYEKSKFEW